MVTTAKKGRRSSTTAVPATPAAAVTSGIESGAITDTLLVQVLANFLGPHLSQDDVLNYRLVCKEWCRCLPAGRKEVVVRPIRCLYSALDMIPSIFGATETLKLYISERLSPTALMEGSILLGEARFYESIKHLMLASTSPPGSKSSTWPFGMPYWPMDLCDLPGLESLKFIGRAAQSDVLRTVAETSPGLTSLVLGTEPQDVLVAPHPEQGSNIVTRPTAIEAIVKLRSLRCLALTLEENTWDWEEDETSPSAQLTALAALTCLTELRLGGAAVTADSARVFLRAARNLRHLALVFDASSGRLHDRKDLALWKPLQHVELRLQRRVLESDVPLLTLGLKNSLRSLHLRSCSVSAYSVTALSSLVALKEFSFDTWTPVGVTSAANGEEDEATTAVCSALARLLAGPLGERLEVLRMDLSDPSKNIYLDMPRLLETWASGSLRVLHLANADAYSLSSAKALAGLSSLSGLQDLRVSVQGQACRDESALRAAWLPPNLTSLELVGIHLPCAEGELLREDRRSAQPQQVGGDLPASHSEGIQERRSLEQPAPSAGAAGDVDLGGPSGRDSCQGHMRLRKLRRLSLHACRFGCCGHMEAALGPAMLPELACLELNDVGGLMEEHLSALVALTGLTSLSIGAVGHSCITSSSMGHVSGLTGLRRLRWHAGDSFDTAPHPAVLKPLRHLAVLDVSQGQWYRMSRWHFEKALAEVLPLCEIAVT